MSDDRPDEAVLGDEPSSPSELEKQYDQASGLSCPNCNGSVWERADGTVTRIECRVGHAFSIDAFLGQQAVALEDALWSAINSLQERATTLRRFADRISTGHTAGDYVARADEVERHARLLREGLARVIQAETAPTARTG
jgi:two-component system chemotaxis response regulator CheB